MIELISTYNYNRYEITQRRYISINLEAVDGLDEAEQARLKQERIQRKKAEQEEQKRKYLPLVKFLKSNGLKFKAAAFKKRSIEYFRVDQFKLFLEAKK